MKQDLRSYIDDLTGNDLLVKVKREVQPKFEVCAVRENVERKLGKAVLFENVAGSNFPVVTNLVSSRDMLALLFGTTKEDAVKEFDKRSKELIPPKVIKGGNDQYVCKTGKDVDLFELPVTTDCVKDALPYITGGIVITKDLETGLRNVSINRMGRKDRNTLKIRSMPPQQLGQIQEKAEKMGKNLPIAVAIGTHPFIALAAATCLPFGEDELKLAGALFKEPLEVIDCETSDLQVPAHSEIILEGEILANVREEEGPYNDLFQFYIPVMRNHVFKVNCIRYKKDAIYQTIHSSGFEGVYLTAFSHEAEVFSAVTNANINLKAVSLMPMLLNCAMSIEKRFEGEPKRAMAAAFGAYSWLKLCVVVDPDVDVFDIGDVWWAMATRASYRKGLMYVTDMQGWPRDPFDLHQSKLGIDATAPLNQWDEFERKVIPGASELKLEDYIQ